MAAAVERGAGLIMVGGFHSFGPGGYAATPLANVLPVEMNRLERQNFGEAIRAELHLPEDSKPVMRPTRIGQAHSIMQLAPPADNKHAWEELPALDGANRLDHVKRGATVLAETADGHPLLIARDYGRGRVLAFGGDSTWRWALGGYEAAHKRFWRQVVLWLARKDQSTDNSVWVNLDERRFSPGRTCRVHDRRPQYSWRADRRRHVRRRSDSARWQQGKPAHAAHRRRDGGHVRRGSIARRLHVDRESIASAARRSARPRRDSWSTTRTWNSTIRPPIAACSRAWPR